MFTEFQISMPRAIRRWWKVKTISWLGVVVGGLFLAGLGLTLRTKLAR